MEINMKKVHTGKDLIISGIITAAGVGLAVVNPWMGSLIAVCGIIMLLLYKAGYKKDGNGPVLTKKAVDVARPCRQSIMDFLDGKDVEPQLDKPGADGIVGLEVYFNKAAGVAYAQLFDFSDYTYRKATEIVELHSPESDKLISKL